MIRLIKFVAVIIIVLAVGAALILMSESGQLAHFLPNWDSREWFVVIVIALVIFFTTIMAISKSKCPACGKTGALDEGDSTPVSRSPNPYWKDNKQYYKVVYRITRRCRYCGHEVTESETKEVPADEFTE